MIEKSPEGGRPVSEEECAQIYSDNVASKLEQTELFDLLSRDEEQLTGTSKGGAHQYPTGGAHLPDRPGWQVLELEGCAPVPLAGYLKALGVLRILGEQLARKQEDGAGSGAEVRGWWERERFMLWSPLDQEGLKSFFLDEYRPTPILAPWNGGSGFYKGKRRSKPRQFWRLTRQRAPALRTSLRPFEQRSKWWPNSDLRISPLTRRSRAL